MPKIKGDGLNDKMKRFVAEYLVDQNALQACIRAGYSANSARVHSNRLMQNPAVKAAIEAKLGKVLNKLEITAERVLLERARLAFLDPRKLVDAKGKALGIHQLDEDTAAAVAGFEVERGRVTKIKLSDKSASLTALEKHLGLYKDGDSDASPLHIHLHLD
ncbi:phage terminase small subunit [Cupriavidus metallidurans]|uniref:terminase small subunit n=1 Tax=Cupriavidus metallidurans TaxID=119219 RepID=UPI000691304E|nr:terminase small subunit [Cupriavidus metallidurans]MDE4918360.1 terminase small subunit [Cupriavidus metallidurans]